MTQPDLSQAFRRILPDDPESGTRHTVLRAAEILYDLNNEELSPPLQSPHPR